MISSDGSNLIWLPVSAPVMKVLFLNCLAYSTLTLGTSYSIEPIESSPSFCSTIIFFGSYLIPEPIMSSLSITPPISHLITKPISSAEYKALSSSSNAKALIGKCGGLSY